MSVPRNASPSVSARKRPKSTPSLGSDQYQAGSTISPAIVAQAVIVITDAAKPNVPRNVSHARSFQLCGSPATTRRRRSQLPSRRR